ncbi:hypothetical protein C8A00DRAFT_45815 [Chaetomidium leptoderma]|uniref:JmjC domain-containing protein n=1 Tax=Chaetomidium leptoderma TaxID=669021 RepID=A0AAN6VGW3_9PEZI|nr:hypothetical protein C8A00DRAFT_45815 [Chaetomidium leptoderma]
MGNSAERVAAAGQDWNMWRNVIDWALLSEGGHNIAPHTDSHGYSTWITEQAWISDPHTYTEGEWRHVVLSPGKTVFFPSGTIHFSSIDQWLEVVVTQVNNPEITNEEMNPDVSKYVEVVKGLVENRIRAGREEEAGGWEVIGRFFSLLEEFQRAVGEMTD